MTAVLVVNSGSSSLKYQLIDVAGEETLASGLIDRIGEAVSTVAHTTPSGTTTKERPVRDHTAAFDAMIDAFRDDGPSLQERPPVAVGHRVVHGGDRFVAATVVTDAVKADIRELSDLAPLHNPANLQGIEAAQSAFPDVPHVAVFDTAFHQTLAPAAYSYAIDSALAAEYGVRRYGFHGTSHKFVSERAAEFLGRDLGTLRQLVLHLGNGASVCAIDGGRSVETSMGLTPLEGLVMGTRSGDLDPAVLLQLARRGGLGIDELDELLNKKSGLLGLSGHGDMRDVVSASAGGDERSALAIAVYTHRITHYIGAYWALLGGLDVITFTAGVGENSADVRAGALAGLAGIGVRIDPERNAAKERGPRVISADDSAVTVLVVPTDEELEIARQTVAVTGR